MHAKDRKDLCLCCIAAPEEKFLYLPIMKKNLLFFFLFFSFSLLAQFLFAQHKTPYKLIAYATGKAETITQYPIDKLTHIIYSFLKIQNDTLTFHNEGQA